MCINFINSFNFCLLDNFNHQYFLNFPNNLSFIFSFLNYLIMNFIVYVKSHYFFFQFPKSSNYFLITANYIDNFNFNYLHHYLNH